MNILIAEDSPILQMLHRKLMEKWGYDYDMASNGLETVEYAKKNNGKYDLCIMDVEMPVMNGIEATKIIRKTVNYFPIMALTANDGYKRECLAAGMDDFTVKPCPHDSLFSKISELTVKSITWMLKSNGLISKEDMPMDAEHAKELKELRKKGLTKLCIHGCGGEFTFIVDVRVQKKISYDLVGKKQEISEFLDRSEDKPGLCHLYKGNFMVNTKYLLPDEFEEHKIEEESILIECEDTVLKPLDN